MWWWARDINMQSDLMQQQYAGKGTCKMVRYMCICFSAHIQHVPWFWHQFFLLIVLSNRREWSYCHFDTSSLWWLTSPSAHILFESRKVMPSWDMLNSNTYAIKHLNRSCHPKGSDQGQCSWIFSDQQKPAIEFWQLLRCVFYHSHSRCRPKHLHPSQPKATSEVTKRFLLILHISFLSKSANLRLSLVFLCVDDSIVSKSSNLSISYLSMYLFICLSLYVSILYQNAVSHHVACTF